jgi:hypothetical protein
MPHERQTWGLRILSSTNSGKVLYLTQPLTGSIERRGIWLV